MDDLISRQAAIEALNEYFARIGKLKRRGLTKGEKAISLDVVGAIKTLPPAPPAQLEQCPIYGGMCCYPSDQCYDCPRHAGAKMEKEVTT